MSVREKIEKLRENIKIPDTKFKRFLLGWALIFGGIFGFLPVVGFWMLPLGIIILAEDYPLARRLKRRAKVWWGKRKKDISNLKENTEA